MSFNSAYFGSSLPRRDPRYFPAPAAHAGFSHAEFSKRLWKPRISARPVDTGEHSPSSRLAVSLRSTRGVEWESAAASHAPPTTSRRQRLLRRRLYGDLFLRIRWIPLPSPSPRISLCSR